MGILKIIKHKDILEQELLEICKIKSVFGNYGIDSQKKWIKDNINDNGQHFLLYEKDELVAYLNLINIEIILNGKVKKAYGVGNVCAKIKNKGYGKKLFDKLNKFLLSNKKNGYLFCKSDLVSWYKNRGWFVLNCDTSKILINSKIISMGFNIDENVKRFKYNGKLF